MNKDIEEMARVLCNSYENGICKRDDWKCDLECVCCIYAQRLYNAGYRFCPNKAEDDKNVSKN